MIISVCVYRRVSLIFVMAVFQMRTWWKPCRPWHPSPLKIGTVDELTGTGGPPMTSLWWLVGCTYLLEELLKANFLIKPIDVAQLQYAIGIVTTWMIPFLGQKFCSWKHWLVSSPNMFLGSGEPLTSEFAIEHPCHKERTLRMLQNMISVYSNMPTQHMQLLQLCNTLRYYIDYNT